MKLYQCLLVIGLLLLSAGVQAQEESISIDFRNTALPTILQEIKRQSDIKLAYDAQNLRAISKSIILEQVDVKSSLDSLLSGTPYEAVLIKNTWLIIPSESGLVDISPEPKRNFRVTGRLINAQSGQPMPYANVSLQGVSGGTVSNLDGFFSISQVSIDSIPLCFSYVGFRTRCIDLRKHETENMLIKLEPANTYLLAVDVIAEQESSISINPMEDMLKLDANSLSRSAATAHSDLFQSVQMLPGVSSGDVLDSQLHIRGGEEDENLVLWDGFTLYHLDHFFGVFSTLNPSVIQDINLLKGPYSSRYGARSGGVLEVNGRNGNKLHPRTVIDMDLIDMGILTEGPVGKDHSYLISFRRSHTDLINTGYYNDLLDRLFAQSVGGDTESLVNESVESDYFYHDLNFKWNSDLSEKDRLSFSLFNGGDRFMRKSEYTYEPEGSPFQYNDIFDDDSEWGNMGLGLTWSRNKNAGHVYTSLGFSDYSSSYYFADTQKDFFNGIAIPKVSEADLQENSIQDITFHHRRVKELASGGTLELGYQFTHLEIQNSFTDRSVVSNSIRLSDSTDVSNQHSVYGTRTRNLTDKLEIRYGGRVSTNSYTDKLYIEPRLRVNYSISSELTAHVASGNYIQPIRRLAEQNLFLRQPDSWALSDGDIIPESRSFHSAIGLSWQQSGLALNAEVFYKELKGVLLNLEQNRILSAFTSETEGISTGNGKVAGVDFLASFKHKAHGAWLAYSYTFSANNLDDINDGADFPSAFNKPHDLKMVYDMRVRDYTFHSQMTASSGYPFTPILGFFEGPGGDQFLVYGDDLSARLPAQFRLDISLSRTFTYRTASLTLGAGIFNLTDHKNIRGRSYTVNQIREEAPEELEIRAVDLELIGLSPTFSLILDFR